MYRKWCRVYLWLSTLLGSHLFELSGQIVADAEVLIYHLTEQNAPNQVLGNVMVDGGWSDVYTEDELSIMEFDFLSASSDYRDYFNIEDDGTLVAASAVDRDDLCENAEDCVIPLDISMRGGPVFEIIKVHVMVDDINDNDPMFSDSEVGRSISEAAVVGAHIIIPTAQDPDSPQNGIQGYKLQEYSPTFTLLVEEETLALVLEAPLDRETQAFYEIEVIAVDGGNPPKEGHMTVYIEVLDVNDHSPEFDNSTYYTSISENLPPFTTVLRVHAVDYDAGEAGEVQYSLSVGTEEDFGDIFGIDAITGDIYTKVRLDYEDEESYRLKVIAEDQSPDSLPSFANVVVDVIDLNDHSPLIMINTGSADGSVEVSEGAPIGAFVAHITVEDVDGGNNGRFVCSLENTNSFQLQKLHETEFKVISTVPFDREAMAEYLMMIRCADLGTPQQVSTQFLTVHITDENDHEPVFLPNVYEATVMEDIPFDEVILQVTATDQDIGDNGRILYTIDESSEAFFWINSSTGELTAHSLDYESDMFLTITVTATDQANPFWFDTASVLITILDADDNAPQFSSYPFVFRILENQLPGTFVGAVTADDPDSAPFNNFTYSIEPDFNGNGHFLIDPRSGSMYTTMPLDREQTALYHLVVTATGTAGCFLENSTNVFISVIDQNDNVPEVLYPTATNHTVYLASNLSVGYVVSRVFVVDNDTDANGYIRYNISSGNTDNIFTIDQDTGAILLAKSLRDYEELTFSLAITISDSGEPPHVVHVVLDLVVNASATPSSGLMSTHNLSIVISIATISALLIIILIIAIYVLTKKQRENKLKKKYNYAARLAEQKNQQNFEKNNPDVTKDAPNGEKGDTEDSLPKKAVLDTRYSKANGMPIWPEPKANYQVNRTPSLNCSSIGDQSMSGSSGTPFVDFECVAPPNPDIWLNARYPADVTPHVIYPESHLNNKAWHQKSPRDNDSVCSADVSNADSGRGSNDDTASENTTVHPLPDCHSLPISPLKKIKPPIITRGAPQGVYRPAGVKPLSKRPPPPLPIETIPEAITSCPLRASDRNPNGPYSNMKQNGDPKRASQRGKKDSFDPSHGDNDRLSYPMKERGPWHPNDSLSDVYHPSQNGRPMHALSSNV